MRDTAGLGAALVASVLGLGCKSDPPAPSGPPARACSVVVWDQPAGAPSTVSVVGDFNGWATSGIPMDATDYPGWRAAAVPFPAGGQLYAIVEDGALKADANVATTGFHAGLEVTWVDVPDCHSPGLTVGRVEPSPDGSLQIGATFLASVARDPLDPSSLTVTERDGTRVAPIAVSTDAAHGAVTLSFAGLAPGKHVLTVRAADTKARPADPAWATVWIAPQPFDRRDTILYQVVVDRYRGTGGAALTEPAIASDRAGGTLDGVRAAVDSGELAALGVNTLWISPLYANPDGWWPGLDGHSYTSYHGYWPVQPRTLDTRLASESDVDSLLADAHAHRMRVLFDVVPNHVHQEHPYYAAHASDGWFDDLGGTCICGVGSCDWATHIQDCWFASYLPDLAWQNPAVADQITSDVAWWLDRFDADGVRIDAVPMMPRAASRRIAAALRAKYDVPHGSAFLLGENFVGADDYDLLRYFLGPAGLDSEFHFPLMWALRSAIADESASMSTIDDAVERGETEWAGAGAVMSTMIGNHDVNRFASESMGEGALDGWTPAVQPPDTSDVYAKQVLALGAVFTLPGAPVVYYGDEVALVGHQDPDTRRVMPAEGALSVAQRATRATVRALGKARACSAALRRGTYRVLFADDEHLVFARELDGDAAVVALFRRSATLSASLPGITAGTWVDALTGSSTSLSTELTSIPGAPLSVRVFFPQGSPCAAPP